MKQVTFPRIAIPLALLFSLLCPIAVGQTGFSLDRNALEIVEDASESLANDLLDLSLAVRERDAERIGTFVADALQATPFPSRPGALEHEVKAIYAHGWEYDPTPHDLSREAFLSRLKAFLTHLSSIEDVRFKVKQATFPSPRRGVARVYFYLVGRDNEGRREWVRGTSSVEARQPEGSRWQIERFQIHQIRSLVATRDLFSEVSVPAGTSLSLPHFGTSGNEGFTWHGAAATDVDLDGDLDLFATGLQRNYLYLNQGDGRFREAASEVQLAYLPPGVAPLFLDYDQDGDPDLFISAAGDQMLFENRLHPDGALRFRDVSSGSGVARYGVGFSAVAGDVNRDGYPDVYVASYNFYGRVMPNSWHRATNGTPNLLFVNQGDGTFREQAAEWGIADPRWSYAAEFVDFDEDGDQDLYVANDYGENALFLNVGARFIDVAEERGVLDPGNGMGVSFGDYDNDGDLDLHVTNMSSTAGNRILKRLFPERDPEAQLLTKLASGNSLYENLGDGTFRNVTPQAGGFAGGWAWGGGFFDFDNDGWEDLYSASGFISGKSMKDT